METKCNEGLHGLIDEDDRISYFPEFILHQILSYLGTKEACRTCILSKKWASVWNTIPFLDFQQDYFMFMEEDSEKSRYYYDFIDRTMQIYSRQQLFVKKLKLELPIVDPQLGILVDSWVQIAVSNGVEELELSFSSDNWPNYRLPEILFTAKSLKILRCRMVELPYYHQVMNLTALQILDLDIVDADEGMLQHIISSCPLIKLELSECRGLESISVHSSSKIEHLVVNRVDAKFNINQAGSLRTFVYSGCSELWPFEVNASALRNLRELKIYSTDISDEVLDNLLYELPLLDTLWLIECGGLEKMSISSHRFRTLHIRQCYYLESAVIDAPNLAELSCDVGPPMSVSFPNIHPQCEAYFHTSLDSTDTSWFVKLKELLIKSNICKVLNIPLLTDVMSKLDVDKLKNIDVGPAYELRELKFSPSRDWIDMESSLSTLLDCLFWICRPAALSITTCLDYDNEFVKSLVDALRDRVECWNHPLKGVQVESIECPCLNKYRSDERDVTFRVKLSW